MKVIEESEFSAQINSQSTLYFHGKRGRRGEEVKGIQYRNPCLRLL